VVGNARSSWATGKARTGGRPKPLKECQGGCGPSQTEQNETGEIGRSAGVLSLFKNCRDVVRARRREEGASGHGWGSPKLAKKGNRGGTKDRSGHGSQNTSIRK